VYLSRISAGPWVEGTKWYLTEDGSPDGIDRIHQTLPNVATPWSAPGAVGAGDIDLTNTYSVTADGYVEQKFDITNFVQSWVNLSHANYGFVQHANGQSWNGSYRVRSCEATTIARRPLLVVQYMLPPASASANPNSICTGGSGSILLSATGGAGDILKWYTGSCGGTLVGTDSPLSVAYPATTTTYCCRWETPDGAYTTSCASVTVTVTSGSAPLINDQPDGQTKNPGETATFSVVATGTGPAYQWQKKPFGGSFQNIGGAQISSYTTPAIIATDNGSQYRCVVSGTCSPAATSDAATLTVNSEAIADGKQRANNEPINLTNKIVTGVFSNYFYIEETNRSSGIKVVPTGMPPGIAVGDQVDLSGNMKTGVEGERYIDAMSVNVEPAT
jgi:hypothetical protein